MNARQTLILGLLRSVHPAGRGVVEIADHLAMREPPVRRALDALVGKGLVAEVHHGAYAPGYGPRRPLVEYFATSV